MEQPAAVNPGWRKSSYRNNGGGNCVEAGQASGAVLIRDTTQNGHGPVLGVSAETWRAFTADVHVNATTS
ncbi:MAG TPA: DUF397 domain-containing protein [Trebonia sp.]